MCRSPSTILLYGMPINEDSSQTVVNQDDLYVRSLCFPGLITMVGGCRDDHQRSRNSCMTQPQSLGQASQHTRYEDPVASQPQIRIGSLQSSQQLLRNIHRWEESNCGDMAYVSRDGQHVANVAEVADMQHDTRTYFLN